MFVLPPQGMPAHVDAIVMLGGRGDRLGAATRLALAHSAPTIVISTPTPLHGRSSGCGYPMPRVRVICFNPDPKSTRGEAEYVGRLARRYDWHSIVLVTIAPQNRRARMRFERCYSGRIYAIDAPFPAADWPYEIAYEWAATLKAQVFQRSC
jgi:hypothetical protein